MLKQLGFFTGVILLLSLLGARVWADITEFELPHPNSGPGTIIVGPDGNLWFTEHSDSPRINGNRIGRFNLADSTFTEFELPNPNSDPTGLTIGPDNNLWFTEYYGNRAHGVIGRITLDGNITEFDLPNPGSGPASIIQGPDGNLWFTENDNGGNRIGMITPQGDITEFPMLPKANSRPNAITVGPDGNLWFGERLGNNIGRITPDGQITEFPLSPNSGPFGITVGPDGNVWFTALDGNRIGRITPDGVVTQFPLPAPNRMPSVITAGPDGNLWFTLNGGNRIGQITTDGVLLPEYDVPTPRSNPLSITTGPDGNIWFTEYLGNKIGRLYVRTPANHFLITAPTTAVSGTPFDITVTALDRYGKIDINYQGTVTFTTTDADLGVVLPADYTFTGDAGDNGAHTFPGGVVLITVGNQTLTATDTVSGITGSINITVGP